MCCIFWLVHCWRNYDVWHIIYLFIYVVFNVNYLFVSCYCFICLFIFHNQYQIIFNVYHSSFWLYHGFDFWSASSIWNCSYMITVPFPFYKEVQCLSFFIIMQAEESNMEEKLKGLKDEVHAAESKLKRLWFYLCGFSYLCFTWNWTSTS